MGFTKFENGMYIVGSDFKIRYANDTLKQFFPKVVEGAVCYQCIADKDVPCTFCPIANNLEKGKLLFNSPNFSRYGAAFSNIDSPEFKDCYMVMVEEVASPNMITKFNADEVQAFMLQQKELKNRNDIIQTLSEEYSAIYFIYPICISASVQAAICVDQMAIGLCSTHPSLGNI